MADQVISGALSQLSSSTIGAMGTGGAKTAVAGTGIGSGWIIGIGIFIGIAVFSIVGAVIWFYYSEKKEWNITTRLYFENPSINGISPNGVVLTKRVRFKDGRVVYMYKTPIQGYTISPELLVWTRPREHDVVITQDKKLFCINGISGIDAQRKELHVDVSYPDIEMDRQDLQQHIDSKKFDDPNDKLRLIAKVATWLFIIIGVIVLVVLGSKTYIDAKNIDAARDATNLKTAELQYKAMEQVNTFILIMSKVMPDSFARIDGQNLLSQTMGGQ